MITLDPYIKKFRDLETEKRGRFLILDNLTLDCLGGERIKYKKEILKLWDQNKLDNFAPSLDHYNYSQLRNLPNINKSVINHLLGLKGYGMCLTTSLCYYYLMGKKDLNNEDLKIKAFKPGKRNLHYWIESGSGDWIDLTSAQLYLVLKDTKHACMITQPHLMYEQGKNVKRFRSQTDGSKKIKIYGEEIKIGEVDYNFLIKITKQLKL